MASLNMIKLVSFIIFILIMIWFFIIMIIMVSFIIIMIIMVSFIIILIMILIAIVNFWLWYQLCPPLYTLYSIGLAHGLIMVMVNISHVMMIMMMITAIIMPQGLAFPPWCYCFFQWGGSFSSSSCDHIHNHHLHGHWSWWWSPSLYYLEVAFPPGVIGVKWSGRWGKKPKN